MNLMTFNLPALGINEIKGAVEFKFNKALQEGPCPVPGLGSRDANKGNRIRVEKKVQAMLMRILHVTRSVILCQSRWMMRQVHGKEAA